MSRKDSFFLLLILLTASTFLKGKSLFFTETILPDTSAFTQKFSDGPLAYSVRDDDKVEVLDGFIKNSIPKSCLHIINLGSGYGSIRLSVSSGNSFTNLDQYANRQKYSWLNSKIGEMQYAQKFINDFNYNGITMTREVDSTLEFLIVLDLTNAQGNTSGNWFKVVIQGSTSTTQVYKTALSIAHTIKYQAMDTITQVFEEILPTMNPELPILDREIINKPLVFSASNQSIVEVRNSYAELAQSTSGNYFIQDSNRVTELEISNETVFDSLENWAANRKYSREISDDSKILSVEKFFTRFGYPAISILRESNSALSDPMVEYEIAINASTDEWRARQPNGWLKVFFSGNDPSGFSSNYSLALATADSLYFDKSSPPPSVSFLESPPQTPSKSILLNSSYTDGPIIFFRPSDYLVECTVTYSEIPHFSLADYQILDSTGLGPTISLSIVREENFQTIEDWASNVSKSWQESENTSYFHSEHFLTENGKSGIAILRKTSDQTFYYQIGVNLSTDFWLNRNNQSSGEWMFAHFNNNEPFDNLDHFHTALSLAKSMNFLDSNYLALSDHFTNVSKTASLSTGIPVSIEGFNWYTSVWLGAYYDSGKKWIYHYWLGWLYSHYNDEEQQWLWSERTGWLWSEAAAYPYLYCQDLSNWIFLDFGLQNSTRCYDYSRGEWSEWKNFFSVEPIDPSKLSPTQRTEYTLEEIKKSEMSNQEKASAAAKTILLGE